MSERILLYRSLVLTFDMTAMVEVAAILATLVAFWKRSRWAGGLLVPYLAWVTFAAVLNVAIWQLNV